MALHSHMPTKKASMLSSPTTMTTLTTMIIAEYCCLYLWYDGIWIKYYRLTQIWKLFFLGVLLLVRLLFSYCFCVSHNNFEVCRCEYIQLLPIILFRCYFYSMVELAKTTVTSSHTHTYTQKYDCQKETKTDGDKKKREERKQSVLNQSTHSHIVATLNVDHL